MNTWYSVYNRKEYPPYQYGFAVNEEGICVMANDKVSGWIIGWHIDKIKTFFENKPVDLTEIKINGEERMQEV